VRFCELRNGFFPDEERGARCRMCHERIVSHFFFV
jgi:hypothetical protein